jgi:peptidoglycan hydrolase CwlO-like protein
MKLKKLPLLTVVVVALLSTGYMPSVFAAEKNSCDIMDAPDIDLSKIAADLQTKIDELTSLQSFLKNARADLADSADKEEAYDVLLKIATTVKTASGVILAIGSVNDTVATSPAVFVTTLLSNLTSTVDDAVNSNSQKELLTGLARNHIDKWSTILDELGKAKAFTGAWSNLSTAYDTFLNFSEMADAWTSKAKLRTQLKGIDKQLANLNSKITTLKTNLTKMKKLVGDNEKKLDKSFLDLINKAKKDTAKTCEAKKDGYTKISNDGSTLPDSAVLGTKPKDWACTKDNKTGLVWEVKTSDGGLRDQNKTYSWYNGDPATHNGYDLFCANNPDDCKSQTYNGTVYPPRTNPEDFIGVENKGQNTEAYTKAVNAQGLCGSSNWRLPTKSELLSLVYCSNDKYKTLGADDYGYICDDSATYPRINTTYFPDYISFWSSSPNANYSYHAWYVSLYGGGSIYGYKVVKVNVRLVK